MSNITKHLPDLADADLRRRVISFLAGRHLAALRSIEVEARGGTVTLRGKVHTFYEKQLTQQCSRRVAGVVRVIDEVDVALPARSESAILAIPIVTPSAAIASAV
jgi:osmotically-inducible protein OsmY